MVSKKFCALFIGLTFLLLAACQPQEEAVVLPTVAVLPSLTPSNTPTLTPSATPTSTATDTPTATATATFTPTDTPTPSMSPTFTITPTFTLTPTNTVTNTPVPTNTSTATNTPVATLTFTPQPLPQILSFTASATNATANSSVTLIWNASADTARIDVMNSQGQVSQTLNVVPSGSLPVTVPGNLGSLVVYRLTVFRGTAQDTRSVPITVTCATPWFFGSSPLVTGCPTGAQTTGQQEFQTFQNGFMIWQNDNSRNTIYGAQNQDSRFMTVTSGWDGTTTYNCFDPVPGGLFAPQGRFAWVYCTTNAPVGGWKNSVGYATGNIISSNRSIQYEDTGAVYIDTPNGVFRFSNSTGTWSKIT